MLMFVSISSVHCRDAASKKCGGKQHKRGHRKEGKEGSDTSKRQGDNAGSDQKLLLYRSALLGYLGYFSLSFASISL